MTDDSPIEVTKTTIRVYLALNQDGDNYVSLDSADDAVGELQDNFNCEAVRTVELVVAVDLPKIEVIPVTVPALSQAPAEVSVS